MDIVGCFRKPPIVYELSDSPISFMNELLTWAGLALVCYQTPLSVKLPGGQDIGRLYRLPGGRKMGLEIGSLPANPGGLASLLPSEKTGQARSYANILHHA